MATKKILAIISSIVICSSALAINVGATDSNSIYAWVRPETETTTTVNIEETTTDTSETVTTTSDISEITTTTEISGTDDTTTLVVTTTIDEEKEMLKEQVSELNTLLEEYGLTVDDLTITVEELKAELNEANRRAANNSSGGGNSSGGSSGNSGGNSSAGSSNSKPEKVTSVTTSATTSTTTTTTTTEATTYSPPQSQGNASLVEEAKKEDKERQFITVAAKNGSVFYIVIDYEGDNENVYFLNKVDVADLEAIANPDGTSVQTAAPVTETEAVTTSEVTDEKPKKKGNSNLLIFIAVGLAIAAGGYYILKIKPKKNAVNDEDEDYDSEDDDYTEEEVDEDKEYSEEE